MIDKWNDAPWPDEVTGRLCNYRQGSLVATPPFAYHIGTSTPLWRASRHAQHGGASTYHVVLDQRQSPPYGIVISQSCDIDEAGRPKKPWVQVAPVYELDRENQAQKDQARQVSAWKFTYLAPVPALGAMWVADLRVDFPVEKSWLILQEPKDAFSNPDDFARFAAMCGNLRSRSALGTEVHTRVLDPLENYLKDLANTSPDLYDAVMSDDQLAYIHIEGDLLSPSLLQLIFVSDQPMHIDLQDALTLWWQQNFGGIELSFVVLPNRYIAYDDVKFRESLHWHDLDLRNLAGSS